MDGSDDLGRLCAMDAEAGLNAQIEDLQANCNVPLEDGTVLGYEVGMTGDGKGMQVANYSPDGKCWSRDDHESLEPVEGVNEQVRRGGLPPGHPAPPACWGLCPCNRPSLQCTNRAGREAGCGGGGGGRAEGGNPALCESGPASGSCDWPRLAMVAGAASL